jgi:hypothetical protein
VSDALQNGFAWNLHFLSERLGFVFVTEPPASPQETAEKRTLVYTVDMGTHWRKVVVPDLVQDCQALAGNLVCSATSKTLLPVVLTIHPK